MAGPIVVKGIAPSNVLEISEISTAVVLVMRRPSMMRSREAKVRWFVWCQASPEVPAGGPPDEKPLMISIPAYPPRRFAVEPYFVADELPLASLPSHPRAVAVAYFPIPVARWRFEFFTDQEHDPDATADAGAFPLLAQHVDCGFFTTPHRAGR